MDKLHIATKQDIKRVISCNQISDFALFSGLVLFVLNSPSSQAMHKGGCMRATVVGVG